MYTLSLLPLVLLQILPHATAQQATVKMRFKNKYGANLLVKFTNPNPSTSNFIGIYAKDQNPVDGNYRIWSGMCGDQESQFDEVACPPQTKGKIRYSLKGPDVSSYGDLPLKPGTYKACLMDEGNVYTIIKCKTFIIKAIPNNLIQASSITLHEDSSLVSGGLIKANYVSKTKTPAVWIGIFKPEEVTSELPHYNYYLYAACNNKDGNTDIKVCSKKKAKGVVEFVDESIPDGDYQLCMSFYDYSPYNKFICSETFSYGDGTGVTDLSLTVDDSIAYDSDIVITFTNPNPTNQNWIAMYNSDGDDELFWNNMCDEGHAYWDRRCGAQTSGTITFKASDPKTESDEQWPALPGAKKVCIIEDDEGSNTPLICESFVIGEVPASAMTDSSVEPGANSYAFGEPITATFNAAVAIQNTWIGIYSSNDVIDGETLPGEPLFWAYSGCNNTDGDQEETNNCVKTKTSGSIQIADEDAEEEGEWPAQVGSYRFCMVFVNNEPYDKYVCSSDFNVV
jgi:hypothetical protein